jgi:hypothetical protein
MSVDLSSFIRFTAQVDGRSTLGLGGTGVGAASEELSLEGTSSVGRFFAAVKNVFLGPSESESRAVQAFIQAIRQEYGSEGAVALKRLGVDDCKPIHSFQVQNLAKTLDVNRSNPALNQYREIPPVHPGLLGKKGIDHGSEETPLCRSIKSAMALHSGPASMLLDDLSTDRHNTPRRKLALAVAVAVMSDKPHKLMAIAEFKAQYQKRLNLVETTLLSTNRVDRSPPFESEPEVAAIVARLIDDIFAQAQSPHAHSGRLLGSSLLVR